MKKKHMVEQLLSTIQFDSEMLVIPYQQIQHHEDVQDVVRNTKYLPAYRVSQLFIIKK